MIDKNKIIEIKRLIEANDKILLFHHVNPDGDCMGTSFGFARLLKDNYPNKEIKVVSDIEQWTPSLRYMDGYLTIGEWLIDKPQDDNYLAIIGDVCFTPRTYNFEAFQSSVKDIVIIDHHENDVNIDGVNVTVKEPTYPSASLMVAEIAFELNLHISKDTAILLAHGILTDTELFSGADVITFKVFSKLLDIIGKSDYRNLIGLIKNRTQTQVKFQSFVLENFNKEDDIAYMIVNQEMIDNFGSTPSELTKISLLDDIEGINYWAFFVQYPDYVRMELRSNSEDRRVDLIAKNFGGGGHKQRSGASLKDMSVPEKVIKYISENK